MCLYQTKFPRKQCNTFPVLHRYYTYIQISYIHIYYCHSVVKLCPILYDPKGLEPARFPCPWGFFRQEYWSGLPFPSPGDFPRSGMEPKSPALAGASFTTEPPRKPPNICIHSHNYDTVQIY